MDCITIEGLEVFAKHGVYKEENILGQKFIINAVLKMDTRQAGLSDNLELSVDYGNVCHFINSYMTENTFKLIETVAENLACEILMKYDGICEVSIEVQKPWAPIGLPVKYASVSVERKWHKAYIATGSNMGERKSYLDFAEEKMSKDANCRVIRVADAVETKPYGVTDQPDFLNSCIEVKTLYTPLELLKLCNDIEKMAGRERLVHWGPRTLDLDIIFYDDEIISEENLIVPHIEMHKRKFVLEPLAQLAPYKVHPILRKRVIEMLDEL